MSSQLRKDLQFKAVEIGNDGLWIYRIYDPVSENYYKINQKVYEIIKHFSVSKSIPDLEDSLAHKGVPGTKEEIVQVILFLKKNKLSFNEVLKEPSKSFASRLLKSYIYFKVPLCRPDKFLSDTISFSYLFLNRFSVILLTFVSLIGFVLLLNVYNNFIEGIEASLNLASIKFFIPTILVIKVIHELSHAYTAKILGCKVRSLGLAFIFMTPRFYTDVSDMVILERKSRLKIALAGIWSEVVIAGMGCFVFISVPLHSIVSQLSIAFIMISLISSFFFNGNPFMKFDCYYVIKEILKIDNLYSNSTLAVKSFWRRVIFGLKPEIALSITLLIYGHLCILYRVFLYTLIVLLVYQFFIPIIGVTLAIIEIWIFLVKPIVAELAYIYRKHKVISLFNKFFAGSVLSGFFYLFFMEISIPESLPALYSSNKIHIRAEIDGEVKRVTDDVIFLENQKLIYSLELLKADLASIKLRKRQMLAQGSYSHLSLLEAVEKRLKLSLQEHEEKLSKSQIKLPEKVSFLVEPRDLIGQSVKPGQKLAYVSGRKVLYVYYDANIEEVINEGELFFKNSFDGISGQLLLGKKESVLYIPECLSSIHAGPVQTDAYYRPLKPLYRVKYSLEQKIADYDSTGYFVYYRKIRLLTEIRRIFSRFLHDEFF